jgi:hypothetical protein
VKIRPKAIVIPKAIIACWRFPAKKALWAQVILTPDDNKIKVFKNGSSKGFNTSIPFGGQTQPMETAGDKLE